MTWRILNYKIEIHARNQTGNINSIISSNTPARPHQPLASMSPRQSLLQPPILQPQCMACIQQMEHAGQIQGRQEETHLPTHSPRRPFLGLPLMGRRGCASAMGAITPTPPPPPLLQSKNYHVINLYTTTQAVEEFWVSIFSNSVILLSLQYNYFCNSW